MGKSKTWYFSEVSCHTIHNQNKSTSSEEIEVCYDISWTDVLFLIVLSAVVVFAFILCWLPFHVGRYLFSKSFEPGSVEIAQISQYCNLVSFVLFYLSAATNPILYNIMSKKYRVAVFKLLGFEPFSQRKLSTLKDESSRAWTESSINTWSSILLSKVIAHVSMPEAIAQQNSGWILKLVAHRSEDNWEQENIHLVVCEQFDLVVRSSVLSYTISAYFTAYHFCILLLVLARALQFREGSVERAIRSLFTGQILALISFS